MTRSRSPDDGKLRNQIYIGYLPNHATMDDVEDFFKGYGKIKTINLKPGYGFVIFEDRDSAEDAVRDLDGKRMCGEIVDIQHAKGPGNKARERDDRRGNGPIIRDDRNRNGRRLQSHHKRSPSRSRSRSISPVRTHGGGNTEFTLRVTNLSTRCSWQDLKDFIRHETRIETAFCSAHRDTVREGIVSFHRRHDMDQVKKECDGLEINGKPAYFEEMSRSRSRSRSRSSSRGSPRRSRR